MKFHKLHHFMSHQKCSFCKIRNLGVLSQHQHHVTFLVGCIVLMMQFKVAHAQAALNSEWPIRVLAGAEELSYCAGLGYPNATKNACGYCTGAETSLPLNYGKDCNGKCGGKAVVDCNGVCGGKAYKDECSGECVGGNTGISDIDVPNLYRDCRGYCLTSGGRYFLDTCGVCNSGMSPFEDCTNKCHLPGQEHLMAKLVCGRCVGGTSEVSISQVLDACGNCRSEEQECLCNGTGVPDPCGVCNGGGRSCMRLLGFTPTAAPQKVLFPLIIKGAFRGRQQNLRCLVTQILNDDNEIGLQMEFVGSGNGTHLTCPRVNLNSGTYRIGASIIVGESPEVDNVEDVELLIYDDANYVDMIPSHITYDRESSRDILLTFTGGRVPPRPLTCIITSQGWPSQFRLVHSEANSHHTCIIPYANTSLMLDIAPSLNGIHPFRTSFPFTFYASPPDMSKFYIAEDGHAVIIVFDRPVNLCELKTCSDMLSNDTMMRLGNNATCQWATKYQLVINVKRRLPGGEQFRVTFRKGVLMQDGQQYARKKKDALTIDASYPQPRSSAQLAISGPSTLPFCGEFTLVGHFSSPKGDAEFYWTALRYTSQRLEPEVASALLGRHTASLALDVSLLAVGVNYTFILTAQHSEAEKYEARHVVQRRSYSGALVTAYSDVMNQPSINRRQQIILQADVTLPECYMGSESVQFMWSVDNPYVKFDFLNRNSQIYKILPFSLPANAQITFTAMAYFTNLQNVTSSKVVLNVEPLILKATVKGSTKRVVGNKDGFLVLESADNNGGIPLVYQWRCYDENRDICYNYGRNATNALLIDRKQQSMPILRILLENLQAGQVLTFELQLFNAKNRYQSSSSASTIVLVENGSLPQVVIQSVTLDGIKTFERNPTTGAYYIPAQLPIIVHATINVTRKMKLKFVKWDIKGFSMPFSYSTLNEDTYLLLEEGFLVDHGIYLVGLSACTDQGRCGIANLTIHAVPGPTLCQLDVSPYVEYEPVEAKVLGCSIPTGRQPLMYQLFFLLNDSNIPLSPPQTSTAFTFFGPPVSYENTSQLSVQVCDKYNLCKLFAANPVKVFPNEIKEEDRLKLLDKAQLYIKTNNPVSALSLFLTAALDAKTGLDDDEAKAMIASAKKAVVNRYVNSGQLGLVYSAMIPLLQRDDPVIKKEALAVMTRATRQAYAHEVKPPTSTLALGHGSAVEALQYNSDDTVKQHVRQTINTIIKAVSGNMKLGSRKLLEGKLNGQPSTLMIRQILNKTPIELKAKTAGGNVVKGIVAFEDGVSQRFKRWKCSGQKICEGALVSLTLYPGLPPYPTTETLISPVFDVTLRNPNSGSPMSESFGEDSNVVRMAITHTGNATRSSMQGTTFKCMYWDNDAKEWSLEGVRTMGVEGKEMTCWASHLSSFAVFEVYQGLSTSSIVGIVVAMLMGVFIFGMLLFVYMRKKQAKAARVSTEALQPKQIEKMRGMERTVAHVKKFVS